MNPKILYVEDEPFLGRIVKETLENRGFEVLLKKDGAQVMAAFHTFKPDVCVLDVMIPNIDGFTLGRSIREMFPLLPVIFLTAKSQTDDVVEGFSSGGTDYIRKPFSMEELIVRINNQLKKPVGGKQIDAEAEIIIGQYHFYPGKYELHIKGTVTRLSHRESQVLKIFASNQNQVTDRKKLLLAVWGDDSFFNSRTLDVYVRKLREYFAASGQVEIITLKGKGYHFLVR